MNRMPLFVLGLSMLLLGCPSVHTMRSAEVLPKGKSEFVVHLGQTGFAASGQATTSQETTTASDEFLWETTAFSYRSGLGDNLDFQVKTDLGIAPEFGIGYQVVGVPGEGGVAATVYGGVKYTNIFGLSIVYVPTFALLDLPLGSSSVTLKAGAMTSRVGLAGESLSVTKPLIGLSARIKLGSFRLIPEFSYTEIFNTNELSEDNTESIGVAVGFVSAGLGLAF